MGLTRGVGVGNPAAAVRPGPSAVPAVSAAADRPDKVRQHLALVAAPAPDDEETFDLGPPADAILDAPCDAETFDDCAYDTMEEEYPCDQEAC